MTLQSRIEAEGVPYATRDEWGARPARSRHAIATPTPELWLHHFATDGWHGAAGMRACQDFHMDSRGWSDIAYSFCVDLDGDIYEGRGAGIAGGHTKGHNTISHAICLMMNADTTRLPQAMVRATAELAAHGQRQGWWGDWSGGHKQASGASTACPGGYGMAALTDIRALTALYLTPKPLTEETLMSLTYDIDELVDDTYIEARGGDFDDDEGGDIAGRNYWKATIATSDDKRSAIDAMRAGLKLKRWYA